MSTFQIKIYSRRECIQQHKIATFCKYQSLSNLGHSLLYCLITEIVRCVVDDGTVPVTLWIAMLRRYIKNAHERCSNVTDVICRPKSFIKFTATLPIATNVSTVIRTNSYNLVPTAELEIAMRKSPACCDDIAISRGLPTSVCAVTITASDFTFTNGLSQNF